MALAAPWIICPPEKGSACLVSHGMDNSQQGVGECHTCQALRIMHLSPGVHIAVIGFLKVIMNHLNRMKRQGIRIVAM